MKNKEAKSIFSSLENYSSIPPTELWDKIEAQLDKPKKQKPAIIWWSIAASLLIGLSVPTILYFNSNEGNSLELNIENKANEVVLQKDSDGQNSSVKNTNNSQNGNDNLNGLGIKKTNLNSSQTEIAAIPNGSSKTSDSSNFKNLNHMKSNLMIQTVKNESQTNTAASNQNSIAVIPKSELQVNKSLHVSNPNSDKYSTVSNQSNDISEMNKNKGT